jgi:hypothetical protein
MLATVFLRSSLYAGGSCWAAARAFVDSPAAAAAGSGHALLLLQRKARTCASSPRFGWTGVHYLYEEVQPTVPVQGQRPIVALVGGPGDHVALHFLQR